jgi:hypothetical protein
MAIVRLVIVSDIPDERLEEESFMPDLRLIVEDMKVDPNVVSVSLTINGEEFE